MDLSGIHHITAITGDAPGNVDFYVRVLGLRMVKKTVNFDAPDVYHLYYADEQGSPGSVLTFFEFPGADPGRPGPGMIHRILWRARSLDSLDHWEGRLDRAGVAVERDERSILFDDPESLGLGIIALEEGPFLAASAPDIPKEHALGGFAGVQAYSAAPDATGELLSDVLEFDQVGDIYRAGGRDGRSTYGLDAAPDGPGSQGAGTVHHIAWATPPEEQQGWRMKIAATGVHVTPIIDRTYFRSIYFREPGGVLFEIATIGPGFTVDEPADSLGEALMLPERYEPFRARLEASLTPLENPRSTARK